jgi:CSLREA domain-containing protein
LFCYFAKVLLLLALLFLWQGNVATAQASAPCDLIATDEASLNEAIGCVNSAGPGRHTIQIMADIVLSQPTEQIVNPQASQIVFEGNDHVIDAQGTGRLFSIYLTEVAIHHLTLRGGLSVGADRLAAGGAILLLGSYGDGTCGLTVRDSTLTDNQSSAGGAIANLCDSSTITITNSILSYNRATRGGAIFIPTAEELVSALVIDQSRLTDNQAQEQGGAILLRAGDAGTDATISNSTIANNRVISGTGGGISVVTTSEPAITEVLLRNVALVNNMAAGGGGLEVYSRGATIVTVANTTISHNHADSLTGGGILVQGALEFDTTDVRLINSTVASNTAPSAGGIAKLDGLITLTNTLVTGNSNGDCQWNASPGLPNRVVSGGNNLDSDGSCLPVGVRQPSDIPTGNANLGPLDDNGGPTVSHVLLTGSQAIDAGNDAVCAAAPINGVDQRGVLRPQGAHCDIGAYERPDAVACGYPVLTANDETTLRQAIDCLNVAPSGAYTLNITADIAYSQPMFRLHNGVLTSVVVAGNGHTLDAQGHGRVLTLEDVQALTLRDLTLTGGSLSSDGSAANGGGVAFDCTRDLLCNWTLINTTIQDNQANAGGGIDYDCSPGGGGGLVVQDSVIRGNRARAVGGGLFYSTDEDSLACSVTIQNSTIENNQAEEGGGLRIARPRVTISDSTIRNNYASQTGGGMMARISDGFIDMTVLRSTINNNRAGVSGGGVYVSSPDQRFDIRFINSTISGNTVDSGNGGGFYLQETEGSLLISLINSTVTQNQATGGAGVHIFDRAEAPSYYTSTLRLTNSLIADNQGSDCTGEVAPGVVFTGQRILSFGHNLDSDGSCLTAEVRQPGDIPNGNANLGPLADNGGPTLTHQPLAGSQAIDAGDDAVCAAAPVNGVDQRGAPRPQDAHCEIGAVETGDGQGMIYTVTKFIDSNDGLCDADCSLREAVDAANRHVGRDEIHLASGVYSLTIPGLVDDEGETIDEDDNSRGDLDITDDLWLTGQGADATTIAGSGAQYVFGGGADRIFEVGAGATVTVEGLTVRYGRVSDMGGGLSNHGKLTLNGVHVVDNHAASGFKIGHGGGIFNDGELTITDSRIANNRALGGEASLGEGGGIRNDGQLTLKNSVITDNSTWDDNDIGMGGGLRNSGTALLEDCTISNNSTSISGEGGGVYNLGELTLRNCTVTQNRALKGAGVANYGPTLIIDQSFLTNNATYEESGGEGGALYDKGGPTTITRSTIAQNFGDSAGGGIVHSSAMMMTIQASTLTGNRTNNAGGAIFNNAVGDTQALQIVNTTIYSNAASVAGGIAIDGGPVSLLNSTVVGNRATGEGGGLGYAEGVTLVNTILANNTAPVGADCSLPVTSLGYNLIGDTNGCTITLLPSDLIGAPGLAAFTDDGTAGGGHLPLQADSRAIDAGDNSVCAAAPVSGVDQLGVTRPQGAGCDIGAIEAAAQGESAFLFVSSRSSGRAGNVTFRDEDIVAYDFTNNTWQMIFDGSDTGVTKDVDAFIFQADGSLLLSFNGPTVVPGVGPVDDSDIVKFTPTRLGSDTAGSFTLYLRGADVGLTTDGEDIDAIGFTAAGNLVVSTIGDFDAPNAQGRDEDLFVWTNGQWQHFFVGANVGLANEDVNGLWIDPATGELYLTVKDDFAFDNVQIDSDDIFVCTPTQAGGCTFRRFWDSDVHDYGSENLDHIGLGSLPTTLVVDGQSRNLEALTAEEIAADEERDDLDLVEARTNVYLPWIVGR